MNGIVFSLFVIGVLLLVGMVHYLGKYQKPAVFPPRRVVKQRIMVLGGGGIAFVLLGFLSLLVTK